MSNPYFKMLRIRMIEEEISRRYSEQKMRCPIHLSIGQEASAVGICHTLTNQDKMVSTHRGHAHYLAKGGSLKGLIGELHGKASGCSRGNGGSMHLIDLDCGFYGSTSIVGGTIPVGVGIAFKESLRREGGTTVICLGDAALEEGVFHESANFAGLHNLKVIFFLENNFYSCFTNIRDRQPQRSIGAIAEAHGLAYFPAKANDVGDIIQKSKWAYEYQGPALLSTSTYRHKEHCGPNNDDHLNYRAPEEVNHWLELDPIKDRPKEWVEYIDMEIRDAFEDAEVAEAAQPMSAYAD